MRKGRETRATGDLEQPEPGPASRSSGAEPSSDQAMVGTVGRATPSGKGSSFKRYTGVDRWKAQRVEVPVCHPVQAFLGATASGVAGEDMGPPSATIRTGIAPVTGGVLCHATTATGRLVIGVWRPPSGQVTPPVCQNQPPHSSEESPRQDHLPPGLWNP